VYHLQTVHIPLVVPVNNKMTHLIFSIDRDLFDATIYCCNLPKNKQFDQPFDCDYQVSEFVSCQKGCQSMCTPGLSLCYGQLIPAEVKAPLTSGTTTTTTTTTAGPIYNQCICKKSTLARSPGV
jgi:hypothetical protein